MSMRPLIAGFVVAEVALNAASLVGQTLDLKPPTTGPEIRPDHDQRRGGKSSVARPGPGQLGIAGWTSGSPPSGVLDRGARGPALIR